MAPAGSVLNLIPATLGGSFFGNVGFNTGVNFDATTVPTSGTQITVVPEPGLVLFAGPLMGSFLIAGRRSSRIRQAKR